MEDNPDLQARAASAIAALIHLCTAPDSTMRVNPAPKLVGNLCAFLCQDVTLTPLFASAKSTSAGILSLAKDPARGVAEKSSKIPQEAVAESDEATKLVYRGAQQALTALAKRFGADLLTRVPKLWSCMADPLLETYGQGAHSVDVQSLVRSARVTDHARVAAIQARQQRPTGSSKPTTVKVKTSSTA